MPSGGQNAIIIRASTKSSAFCTPYRATHNMFVGVRVPHPNLPCFMNIWQLGKWKRILFG